MKCPGCKRRKPDYNKRTKDSTPAVVCYPWLFIVISQNMRGWIDADAVFSEPSVSAFNADFVEFGKDGVQTDGGFFFAAQVQYAAPFVHHDQPVAVFQREP